MRSPNPVFKIGDLVRDKDTHTGILGIITSPCRRSTARDNYYLGLTYCDVAPVVDVLFGDRVYVYDIDLLELVSEGR